MQNNKFGDDYLWYKQKYLKLGFILITITLPFQKTPEMFGIDIPRITFTDELSGLLGIVIIGVLALISGRIRIPRFALALALFIAVYIVISTLDGISIIRSAFGLFDAIKLFFPAMIAYSLVWKEREIVAFIKSFSIVAVVLSVSGIIFGGIAEITHSVSPLFSADTRAFGLHRLVSFTGSGNWNYLGVYLTLAFFLVTIWASRWVRITLRILITIGLIWTQSRQAFLGFIIMSFVLLPTRQKISALVITSITVLISISFFWNAIEPLLMVQISTDPERYFRLYAFIALWKTFITHPWIGLGPTTAGSLGSFIFDSNFYNNWPPYLYQMAFSIQGVDQYWTVVLAEIGILGLISYLYVFIKLRVEIVNMASRISNVDDFRWQYIGKVLAAFMIAFLVMGLAGGLNSAFVTWAYFGITGAYLSYTKVMIREKNKDMLLEAKVAAV